jgi:hypothetical protein
MITYKNKEHKMANTFFKNQNSTKLSYYNNKRTNTKRTKNKELIYICGDETPPNDSPLDSSVRGTRGAVPSDVPKLDLIYKEARQKIRQQEKLFFISCSISSKPGKRRKLNVDIIPEPGDRPSKYICSLAPYKHQHGVFQNIPQKTKNWAGWDMCKQLYKEFKQDASFGKFVQRTTYTKNLSRTIAPGMLGGLVIKNNTPYAVLFIYDKEYFIPLQQIKTPTDDDKSGLFYYLKGTHQEDWVEGEYDDLELDDMEDL